MPTNTGLKKKKESQRAVEHISTPEDVKHALKTPLTSLFLRLQLMRGLLQKSEKDQMSSLLEGAISDLKKLEYLINSL